MKNEMGGACGTCGRQLHAGFWWGYLIERDHLVDLGIDGTIILKLMLKRWDGEARTGLIWLRMGRGGERL
jgi:hypothetical protein